LNKGFEDLWTIVRAKILILILDLNFELLSVIDFSYYIVLQP